MQLDASLLQNKERYETVQGTRVQLKDFMAMKVRLAIMAMMVMIVSTRTRYKLLQQVSFSIFSFFYNKKEPK